jgi:predicted ATP-dependent protease
MVKTCLWLFFLIYFGSSSSIHAKEWDAKINFINFKDHEKEKIIEAIKLIKTIIQDHEFEKRVKNFNFKRKHLFHDNKGFTNEEIFQKIIDGVETVGDEVVNNRMDVELELYEHPSKTIGYTYPDTKRIWINRKYFKYYRLNQIANNLMHEWMHKLGFNHDTKWSTEREYTVPYAIGNIFEEIISEKLSQRVRLKTLR